MLKRSTLAGLATVLLSSTGILAADLQTKAPVPVPPPAEPCKATLLGPTYGGLIKANPNPTCFAAGSRTSVGSTASSRRRSRM